jgi:hypothetical protein
VTDDDRESVKGRERPSLIHFVPEDSPEEIGQVIAGRLFSDLLAQQAGAPAPLFYGTLRSAADGNVRITPAIFRFEAGRLPIDSPIHKPT